MPATIATDARNILARIEATIAKFGKAACEKAFKDHMNGTNPIQIGEQFVDPDAEIGTILFTGMEIIEAGSPFVEEIKRLAA